MTFSTCLTPDREHVISVHRCDRWSICRRLQELKIPCNCPADGTLRVNVRHAVELLLVNSVVRRFSCPRQASIGWLERCWETPAACTADR